MNPLIHRVNHHDQITFVNAGWKKFAIRNGMPAEMVVNVVGASLWRYISEPTSRNFYAVIMAKVRKTGQTIKLPFRCDSPGIRRFMELHIISLGENHLEFRSHLLRQERRKPVALLNPALPRDSKLLIMCAWCKRVKADEWMEVEDIVQKLKLFDTRPLPSLSHGICPDCKALVKQSAGR